jgi:hypothetical protein
VKCDQSNLQFVRREVELCVKFGWQAYIAEFSGDVAWNQSNSTVLLYVDYCPGGDLYGVIQLCDAHSTTVHPMAATYWALEIGKAVTRTASFNVISSQRTVSRQRTLSSV